MDKKERDVRIQCATVHDNGKRCQNEANAKYRLTSYIPSLGSIEIHTCEDCFRIMKKG